MMIKGGSFVSTGNESFRSARYAFRRHFHQFAGFRYVTSDHEPKMPDCCYSETDEVVEQFLKIHYLDEESYIRKVSDMIVEKCMSPEERILIVGCSVGKMVLEMSKHFK